MAPWIDPEPRLPDGIRRDVEDVGAAVVVDPEPDGDPEAEQEEHAPPAELDDPRQQERQEQDADHGEADRPDVGRLHGARQ